MVNRGSISPWLSYPMGEYGESFPESVSKTFSPIQSATKYTSLWGTLICEWKQKTASKYTVTLFENQLKYFNIFLRAEIRI